MCLLGSAFLSLPLPSQTAAKPAEREPTIKIGGLVQGQLEAGDRGDSRFADDNDRIYLRRARLNAVGRFLEEFDFKLELDLAGTLGNTSGLRAQLTDGYVNWNRYPSANIRVGQFKTPFGFEQLYTDARLITAEHSAANDRLTLSRQLGAQVGGELFERRVSYSVGLFNGTGANNNFNDNDDFLLAARASAVAFKTKLGGKDASWAAAVNGFRSEDRSLSQPADFGFDSTPGTPALDNLFTGEREGIGLDSQFQFGPLEIWSEYIRVRFSPVSGIPRRRLETDGWYAQAAYMVLPPRLQAVLKYESFDPNADFGRDDTKTWTLGLSWYFKGHDLKIQLNYLSFEVPGSDGREGKLVARLQAVF